MHAISQFGHFLIKKGVTFFSAAQKVRHSARLGAESFPMLFGLLLLIVYLVLSLFMTMCALFPNLESHYIISETGCKCPLFQFKSFVGCAFFITKVCSVRFFTSKVCRVRFFRLQKFVECAF